MALKKGFFKGLQGGVNHSPLRMHDGTKNTGPGHSKKTVNIQQQVNNDQLQFDGQNSIDPKSSQYRQMYNQGDIFNPSLDEVVIDGRVDYDKFPYYDDLNKQEKEIFHNDQSPIGDAVRRRGYTKKGLAEDTTDMVTNMLVKQPLSALQAPQSLLVEGIEALRGNDYNFANAITNDTQRLPSETIGFEDKPGWDLGGSLNTIMDVAADPSNLVGVGAATKGLKALTKLKNIPKNFSNLASSIGKNTDNAVTQFGKENASTWNKLSGRFKPKVKEDMYNTLESLAEGADMSAAQRKAMIERINSPEGKKRLFDQELGFLESQLKNTEELIKNPKAHYHPWIRNQDPLNPNLDITESKLGGLISSNKKLFKKDLSGQAKKNVEFRIQELSKPNVNELAKEAIQGGELNYSKGSDLLYNKKLPENYLNNNATFGGQIDGGTSRAMNNPLGEAMLGPQQGSQVNDGVFVLGGKGTKNKPTWGHEVQHGGQAGRVTPLDKELSQIEPNQAIKKYEQKVRELKEARDVHAMGSEQGYSMDGYRKAQQVLDDYVETSEKFFKKNGDQLESYKYFKTGSGGKEPVGHAGELRQSLIDGGFLKNEYDNITPHMLLKAKNHFKSNPVINKATIAPGQEVNLSTHRIFDFMNDSMENLTKLSGSLNKLPLSVVPIVGASTMLSQNKE